MVVFPDFALHSLPCKGDPMMSVERKESVNEKFIQDVVWVAGYSAQG